VSIQSGTHPFGPDNAKLSVRTERAGAAAAAGHDLVFRVNSWEGKLSVGEDPAEATIELTADPTSLRVVESSGGMEALDDRDTTSIHETIDAEVLEGREIAFRSTKVQIEPDGGRLQALGELTLAGQTRPVEVDLVAGAAGELTGHAAIKQSDWGMKPYSTLFGALKVKDEVVVVLEAHLQGSQSR
jgi:polyisoprenoid-binding protein YceI